jgi:hypothetical protein
MGRLHLIVVTVVLALVAPTVICVIPGTATVVPDCCQHMSAPCGTESTMSACCSFTVPDYAMTVSAARIAAIDNDALDALVPFSKHLVETPAIERLERSGIAAPLPPTFPPGYNEVLRV